MTPEYTPMVQQYLEVKRQHENELLFFRLGDFYELFFEDALTASKELNITLTGRAGGLEDKIPMCGVPYHAVDGYIAKLVSKGYRIAICEQVEDPKLAKGIVRREVIKIITPGTALNEQLLEANHNQYLVVLTSLGGELCLSAVDISTGECLWFTATGDTSEDAVWEQLYRLQPSEIVLSFGSDEWGWLEQLLKQRLPDCMVSRYMFEKADSDYFSKHFGNSGSYSAIVRNTVEIMLSYLHETVKSDLTNVNRLVCVDKEKFMNLDATAIRNLELVKNMRDGTKHGTLLEVLDQTSTSMGGRKLRQWIECPLLDFTSIIERQEAISGFVENVSLREGLSEKLKNVFDLERILARLEVGSANARDLISLKNSLEVLPAIKALLASNRTRLISRFNNEISLHEDIYSLLASAIVDEPPFTIREGGMIRDGYHVELDELHTIASDNKIWMRDFELRIKEESGIKTLKVGYNKVFGYYIEVSKGSINLVPEYFIRKQTLVNAERYIVPELKEFENKILSAKEKIQELEYYLFNEIRDKIRARMVEIQTTARALGNVDALLSLSIVAFRNNYIRPELNNRHEIAIKDGRHPVVEKLLQREIFVPNDTMMDAQVQRVIVLTGPNMAGKSTYMRQVALLVLMTQIGSFIPARAANICPVDKIFTRVGASDDLATGQSTFMVEMNEVAQILRYATSDSLIILDEVGRGTSTFDGMSIARSVVEFINEKIKAKTLFATHYHQLIELENVLPEVKNYSVAVKERGKEVIFLRRIIRGGTDRSYGIHVAQLAGLPKKVISRAEEILQEYDGFDKHSHCAEQANANTQPEKKNVQASLFTQSLCQSLISMDVMTMTPLEALNALYKLQEEAKREGGLL
ncbi:MAG: DNA mismatch repair protein MutS [Acidaminococcaceae bacterium]|nr:DNA mismatch repair protein MutS [Acidaminococcaceae bacterium]